MQRCDGKSLAICDFELRFLSPKTPSFCEISGDVAPSMLRDSETTIKFALLKGGGLGAERNIVQIAAFRGKRRDNKILKLQILLSRNFVAITQPPRFWCAKIQARKKNPNLNFWVRIFSGGVGVFHVKGWGPKSSVCPSKPRESNFFGGISRDFAGISRKRPKSLRKQCLGSILVP